MKKSLKKLLSPHINGNDVITGDDINIVKKTMKKYISSPYDYRKGRVITMKEYKKYLKKYKINPDKTNYKFCKEVNKVSKLLCQSHGGNLWEHSQWCALQLLKWHNDNHKIVKGLDLELLIVSGFFHDIAKSGDCVETCHNDFCWRDMYSEKKYNKSGDYNHPKWCGDVILGKTTYVINCQNGKELSIPDVIENKFNVDLRKVALAAYMHWEFGKINIVNDIPLEKKIRYYLKQFRKFCKVCRLKPNNELLRLCIAVGAADVSSGSNYRVKKSKIKPLKMVFVSKDPWVYFKFNRKFNYYRNLLIDAFNKN